MSSDALEPRQARFAIALATLGLLLTATGAVLMARPFAFALVALPLVALCAVVWRSRQTGAI